MLGTLVGTTAIVYGAGALYGFFTRDLHLSSYPSPGAANAEIDDLVRRFPSVCTIEVIGQSTQRRPIRAVRLHGVNGLAPPRPRLLITAHIHAVEYIGSFVARTVARRLAEGYGQVAAITGLLDRADIWIVPLVNPDGAVRVWRQGGWTRLGGSRFTANGVDPNRNFPFVTVTGRQGWNTGSARPGSAYYRGPHPLSEPECLAVARLCKRERFCAAINFHSFGGVVFMPQILSGDAAKAARAFAVFEGVFQSRQQRLRYRPVPERSAKIVGQLDPFLLNAFGTPSVTVEVSRPSARVAAPWNLFNVFHWANPARPQEWADNDAEATIHALAALLEATGGTACTPARPELADQV